MAEEPEKPTAEPKKEAPKAQPKKEVPKTEPQTKIVPVTSKLTHVIYICIIILIVAGGIANYSLNTQKAEKATTMYNESATELATVKKELSEAQKSLSKTLTQLKDEKNEIKTTSEEANGLQKQLDDKITELKACQANLTKADDEFISRQNCDKLIDETKDDCNSYMAQVKNKCVDECLEIPPFNVTGDICEEMEDNVNLADFQYDLS